MATIRCANCSVTSITSCTRVGGPLTAWAALSSPAGRRLHDRNRPAGHRSGRPCRLPRSDDRSRIRYPAGTGSVRPPQAELADHLRTRTRPAGAESCPSRRITRRRPKHPRHPRGRLRRPPREQQHKVLDWPPTARQPERPLPGRLGVRTPRRGWPHIQPPGESPSRSRGGLVTDTTTADRLHHGPVRRTRPDSSDRILRATVRQARRRYLRHRPLRSHSPSQR
jgi:hypothetical protein